MGDFLLRGGGADDGEALRELVFARVLALADAACASTCAERARERAEMFDICMRSIAGDATLTDLYERLVPVQERVRRRLAST